MVFPEWLNSQIDSIKEIACSVDTRPAIESLIFWSLNLADVSFCNSTQSASLKAGQLAIDYACDVTTIAKKLRNFFPGANQRCPAVTRTWILLNPAHIMSFK
jgi:hypothetical protein